jgi:hypothetical protein
MRSAFASSFEARHRSVLRGTSRRGHRPNRLVIHYLLSLEETSVAFLAETDLISSPLGIEAKNLEVRHLPKRTSTAL